MNYERMFQTMQEAFDISVDDAALLLFHGPRAPVWTVALVTAQLQPVLTDPNVPESHRTMVAAFLPRLEDMDLRSIGFFLHGVFAARAGEILADADPAILTNLLAALDVSRLSYAVIRALLHDWELHDVQLPKALADIFETIDMDDDDDDGIDASGPAPAAPRPARPPTRH